MPSTPRFITASGINYAGTLPKIKKHNDILQPLYEALTNSFESIRLARALNEGKITIRIYHRSDLFSAEDDSYLFDQIEIEDNGVGFTNDEFLRLQNLNDTSKPFSNKGTGRIQLLHSFDKSEYSSIYKSSESNTGYQKRNLTLSKSPAFLEHNSIIREDSLEDVNADQTKTILTLKGVLDEKDMTFYRQLNTAMLKENIISKYLDFLCENRDHLPQIIMEEYLNGELKEPTNIVSEDIPQFEFTKPIIINYKKLLSDGKTLEKTENSEVFNIKAFKIPKNKLQKNGLKLTSKGEIAKDLKLNSLQASDHIDDNRYLFLLSSEYINKKDSDTRGELNIPTLQEFKKSFGNQSILIDEEEILLDDIESQSNESIENLYPEIKQKTNEKLKEVEKLQEMFYLSAESIKEAKIKLNDNEGEILEKVYKVDAKLQAKKDAEIKKRIDILNTLDPSKPDFQKNFQEEVAELARAIPIQNRSALTHYIARRKLVLELFQKILDKQLNIQEAADRKADEKLLHNLIFQQGSTDPQSSDLWIVNEDFIYFSGVSEHRLKDVKINGKKLFKDNFSVEEERYLKSLGENRIIKRPDILLFPAEGKCIIIELKDPDVNASEHLTQLNKYASLIRNYTNDEFQINTFYGYLVGENIEPRDVMGMVSNFEHSYHFDYLFKPAEKVQGWDGRSDGSIYVEVIKYSSLLQRAMTRNKIFMDKLGI